MKFHSPAHVALQLLAVAWLWIAGGCAGTPTDKIPITTSSSEAMGFYVQGRDLSEKLQEQESIKYFEKAILADPSFAMAYLELSLVQPTAKGFFEQLAKAMSLVDQVTEGERLQILGIRAVADADPKRQIDLYEKLVEKYPRDERAHNLLATALFSQEEYERAIVEYEKATEIAPDFSQPYNQLGYAHKYLGDFSAAQDAFRHYIDLIPDDPNPYDSYAELLMKMGRFEASMEQYEKALSLNPNFVASHIGIATVSNFRGDHQGARHQLQGLYRMARDDGERREALLAKAVSYVDEGNPEMAMLELQNRYAVAEAIADASAMAADVVLMGRCLYEEGRYDEAQARFDRARDLIQASKLSQEIKDNAQLTYLFNTAKVDLKKWDFAAAHAKADTYLARAAAKGNPVQIRRGHELLAMIALEEQDFDDALAELNQASQVNPYNYYRMALAYEGKGDSETAREYFKKAAEYHALNSLDYAFIRTRATQRLAAM